MSRRARATLATVVVALAVTPAVAAEQGRDARAPVTVVRMLDDHYDRFRPAVVTVTKGTRVRWVNRGDVTHTATTERWDSGSVAPGESYSRRFRRVGTFDYVCVIHPEMTGTVVVEPA